MTPGRVEIEYDDGAHTYHLRWGGARVRVPSVTQVLRLLKDYGPITDRSRIAMDRGTAVHDAIMLIEGGGDGSGLGHCPEEIVPYVEAYRLFVRESGWRCLRTEQMAASWKYKVACRYDQVGKFGSFPKESVLELKTGATETWHAAQTAGQVICMEEGDKRTRYVLNLKPNGKYKLAVNRSVGDRALFLSCLAVTHWRIEHGNREDGT